MKPIFKRIFPFVIGGAVVVFAACQDTSQNPTEPAVLQQARGGSLQSQINQAINAIWPGGNPNRSLAHSIKSQMFDAGAGTPAAQAFAEELILLAESALPGADPQAVADLIHYASMFSGLSTNAQFVSFESMEPVVVTSNPDLGAGTGFAGVEFMPGDLPVNVVVIIEQQSQPCHPLAQLPNQEDGCFSFRTIPDLGEDGFNPLDGVLIGVCTDETAPNFPLLRLFESQGPNDNSPVVLLPEEATPGFLVPACLGFGGLAITESNWLGDFARAGWHKVGKPLASLLAPEPLHAATFLATSGSLGGRTKNFSNIGWAEAELEVAMSYRTDGYRYMELDRGKGDTPPAGFETPGFDDSGEEWSTGGAPFWEDPGTANCPIINPDPRGTTWTAADAGVVPANRATEILLRKHFTLPQNASNVTVAIAIDNDVQVWVNGVDVSSGIQQHEGCATEDSFLFSVGIGDVTVPGVNLLVVRGIDRGVMSYVDAQVTYLGDPLEVRDPE